MHGNSPYIYTPTHQLQPIWTHNMVVCATYANWLDCPEATAKRRWLLRRTWINIYIYILIYTYASSDKCIIVVRTLAERATALQMHIAVVVVVGGSAKRQTGWPNYGKLKHRRFASTSHRLYPSSALCSILLGVNLNVVDRWWWLVVQVAVAFIFRLQQVNKLKLVVFSLFFCCKVRVLVGEWMCAVKGECRMRSIAIYFCTQFEWICSRCPVPIRWMNVNSKSSRADSRKCKE